MKRQGTAKLKKAGKSRGKVFVGMSGGVDSSVSAALLKQVGYDVTGVFIKVWQADWLPCSWREERLDAMRVAAMLGIPFVTLDLSDEYKKDVVDYMIAEYAAGRTPNPDVMCNRSVKFGAFWNFAKKEGADYIATGHYARAECTFEAGHKLYMGADSNKDQSYFLWKLNQNDLLHILFPVGHLEKPEVRKLAARFELPTAEKKDSQGLCFMGKVDVKDFLAHYLKLEKGDVTNGEGKIIGTHPGALLFTIGERHGFTITSKTSNDMPYYVVAKDVSANTITVLDKAEQGNQALYRTKVIEIRYVNWTYKTPKIGAKLKARSRYRQSLQDITIESMDASRAKISFKDPQTTLTPGQSLVIYDGVECLGGGVIG